MLKNIKRESGLTAQAGQASRLLLVLAVVVLVAVIITFLVMKMAEKPASPATPTTPTVAVPVYEKQLGDIDFIFQSAIDRGNLLKASDIKNTQYSYSNQNDLPTTEKFIQVTVGAKNYGTENTEQGAWNIGNIVDSEGRNFEPLSGYTISPWLPNPDLCGTLLKPNFQPIPCTKIYEVSKESTGLKIKVETGQNNSANNLSSGKIEWFAIDIIVK